MATREKVTPGEVVSAKVRYTNQDDTTRKFNITADVNISNKKATNFENGNITRKESTEYGNANFHVGENLNFLSFNSNGLNITDARNAFDAMLVFIEAVNVNVESSTIEQQEV